MARVNHKITAMVRARTFDITKGLCWYCGGAATTVDHGHPLSKGGSKKKHNLYPACDRCNQKKENMTVDEFRSWLITKYTPSVPKLDRLKRQLANGKFYGEENNFILPPKELVTIAIKRDYLNQPKAGLASLSQKLSWSTE